MRELILCVHPVFKTRPRPIRVSAHELKPGKKMDRDKGDAQTREEGVLHLAGVGIGSGRCSDSPAGERSKEVDTTRSLKGALCRPVLDEGAGCAG